jgi:hypothetical protein
MSLNWDATKIKYFKDNPDELYIEVPYSYGDGGNTYTDLNVETKSLVFGSMSVGIGSITNKNYLDFYARWKVLEKLSRSFYLYSTFVGNEKNYQYLTLDVVKKHIGLATNVGFESQTKWSDRIAKGRFSDELKMTAKEINAYTTVFKMEAKELEIKNAEQA